MVMLLEMTKLMRDDVVHAITRRFHEMWVEEHNTLRRAAAPLPAHLQQPQRRHFFEPWHIAGDGMQSPAKDPRGALPVPTVQMLPNFLGRTLFGFNLDASAPKFDVRSSAIGSDTAETDTERPGPSC